MTVCTWGGKKAMERKTPAPLRLLRLVSCDRRCVSSVGGGRGGVNLWWWWWWGGAAASVCCGTASLPPTSASHFWFKLINPPRIRFY